MADGAACFGQGSSDPALLRVPPRLARVPRTGLSPSPARLPMRVPLRALRPLSAALLPRARLDARGLGWPPFARRYSGGHCCFPFLRLLGCFGSPGWPPPSGGCRASSTAGCPIRVPADPRLLAPPRGLSRPAAPFVASGSHRHPPCALSRSLAAAHPCARPLVCLSLCSLATRVSRVHLREYLFFLSHPVNEPSGAPLGARVGIAGIAPAPLPPPASPGPAPGARGP